MDREIKFRGKNESNQFIFGDLIQYENGDTAIFEKKITRYGYEATQISNRTKVDKETIGQFTGLQDKNGKEIYEGDIVLQQGYHGNKQPMVVKFECGAFIVGYHKGSSTKTTPMLLNSKCEVIGNLFDNPELLEDKK